MKSFEQIARAMYEAYCDEVCNSVAEVVSFDDAPYFSQLGWIAAARAAHKEITEVH